ncbi:MAG: S8 family serine peptidase, partial [Arenibacterium sp.]
MKNTFLKTVLFFAATLLTSPFGYAQEVQQSQTIFNSESPNRVPGQFIIVMQEDVDPQEKISDLQSANIISGDANVEFNELINGFTVGTSEEVIEALRIDPDIEFIEAVTEVRAYQQFSWGIDRIDQRSLPLDNTFQGPNAGAGVTVYVVDTGIRVSHQEFGGRATAPVNADFVQDGQGNVDCDGHGTHVAGTAVGANVGVAPAADVIAVRVLDCDGGGTSAGVINGLNWVSGDAAGPSVVNLSLGGGPSAALDRAVQNLVAQGVSVVAAAGNDYGSDACTGSPARVDVAITVGSTNRRDERSGFSNIGTCIDVFAPGSSIISANWRGDSLYRSISGTSMAAPHVAGYAALVLSNNNGLRPNFVGDLVIRCATDGVILAPGAGSPNRLLFVSEVEPRECPGWLLIAAGTPALADGSGWADHANYSTIQSLDVGGVLHLVARGDAGIFTYRL